MIIESNRIEPNRINRGCLSFARALYNNYHRYFKVPAFKEILPSGGILRDTATCRSIYREGSTPLFAGKMHILSEVIAV